MTPPITLDLLEQLIRNGRARFPASLQAAYEEDRRKFLAFAGRVLMLRTIIGYNLFIPLDFLLAPKTAVLATTLHLAAVTPLLLYAAAMVKHESRLFARDMVVAMVPILITFQIMLIFRLNTGENAWAYQYLAMLVMVYTNVNLMLTLRFSLAASFGVALIYAGALLTSGAPTTVKLTGCVIMLGAAYLSLESKFTRELSSRNQFLRRQRERLQRYEAESVASRDALTGLSNRRHLDERIASIWASPDPAAQYVAIVMIDIDHFKMYNDFYGHPAGDHCLRRVASAISSVLRCQEDLAARLGGEEFVLLLPDTTLETAIQIAERVRRAIESLAIPHELSPTGRIVTASLGISSGPATQAAGVIISAADEALYKAKRAGRNQVFPPFMVLEPKPAKVRRTAV